MAASSSKAGKKSKDVTSIPIVVYWLLISGIPDQRSKAIQELRIACEEWGFFVLVNHSISMSFVEEMIKETVALLNLTEKEKQEYMNKQRMDPIHMGTNFITASVFISKSLCTQNSIQQTNHLYSEFCRITKEVGTELLKGIYESLGLEANNIHKAMDLDSGLRLIAANLYPPISQPELAKRIPPHSDNGLLNILIDNGVGGLQMLHNDKWLNLRASPNHLWAFVGEYLEIMTSSSYKSILYKGIGSNPEKRVSIATIIAPSTEAMIKPAVELQDDERNPALYNGMKLGDLLELQQSYGIMRCKR